MPNPLIRNSQAGHFQTRSLSNSPATTPATPTDRVLDLNPGQALVSELTQQDLSKVTQIRVNNQVLQAPDQTTLRALVAELREQVLQENQLRPDFREIVVDLNPGARRSSAANLQVISSELPANVVESVQAATRQAGQTLANYNTRTQGSVETRSAALIDPAAFDAAEQQIDQAIADLQQHSDLPGSADEIAILQTSRDMLGQTRQHAGQAQQVRDAQQALMRATTPAAVSAAQSSLTTAREAFNAYLLENGPQLPPSLEAPSRAILEGASTTGTEMQALQASPEVRQLHQLLDRGSDSLNMYGRFLDVRAAGRRERPNESLNPAGYIQSLRNDIADDRQWAEDIRRLSQRVQAGGSGPQILDDARRLFQSESGRYVVAPARVQSVLSLLQANINAQQAGQLTAQARREIAGALSQTYTEADRTLNRAEGLLNRAETSNRTAQAQNRVSLAGFGQATVQSGERLRSETQQAIVENTGAIAAGREELSVAEVANAARRPEETAEAGAIAELDPSEIPDFASLYPVSDPTGNESPEELREMAGQALRRLEAQSEFFGSRRHHMGIFSNMYQVITRRAVRELDQFIANGDQNAAKFEGRMLVNFANKLFTSMDAYNRGDMQNVSPVWQRAFSEGARLQAEGYPGMSVSKITGQSMVAHIMNDLPLTLQEIADLDPPTDSNQPELTRVFRDFNVSLMEEEENIMQQISQYYGQTDLHTLRDVAERGAEEAGGLVTRTIATATVPGAALLPNAITETVGRTAGRYAIEQAELGSFSGMREYALQMRRATDAGLVDQQTISDVATTIQDGISQIP